MLSGAEVRGLFVSFWCVVGWISWSSPAVAQSALPETEGVRLKAVVLVAPPPAGEVPMGISDPRCASGPALDLPPVLSTERLAELVQPYLGQVIDEKLTSSVIRAVVGQIEADRVYLADVYFPPEANRDIREGVLALSVQPARVGRVVSRGQQHYAAADIVCRIGLQSGQPLDLRRLSTDIARLNAASNWRYTNPSPRFLPGSQPGTTDVELETGDEAPWRVFSSADNSGTRATDQGRLRAGFSIANVFGLFDHQFGYSHLSSPNHKHFFMDTFDYALPLDGGDRLLAHVEDSQTDVELQDGVFRHKGQNFIASLERRRMVQSYGTPQSPLNQEVFGGIEFKRIGSTLAFDQLPISDVAPKILQGYAGWRGSWRDGLGANLLDTRLTVSPGNLLDDNDDRTFNMARPNAKAGYWRWNATYDRSLALPGERLAGWQLNMRLNAQLSSGRLLASERFGVTGVGGVRGYYQDTLISDGGLVGSLELLAPQHTLDATKQANWQLFGFLDAGRSWNADEQCVCDLERTGRWFTLASAGLGARFNVGRNLTLRVDLAHPLVRAGRLPDWFAHGALQLSF